MSQEAPEDDPIATVFLFELDESLEVIHMLLDKIVEENAPFPELAKHTQAPVERFYEEIKTLGGKGLRVLMMFVRSQQEKHYFPVLASPFIPDDAPYVRDLVNKFFDVYIGCGNVGFELKTNGSNDQVLALCIEALFENRMMQLSLDHLQATRDTRN